MSDAEDEERALRMDQMRADIANKDVDSAYKRGLLKYEPWKLVVTAFAAGGGVAVGGAAVLGLLLHLMGKL